MLDRKVVNVLNKMNKLEVTILNDRQLQQAFHLLLKTEQQCKWFHTSCICKNMMRRFKKEIKTRFNSYQEVA